jgi:hypothetical protein
VSFVCPMNVRLGEVRERARSPYINNDDANHRFPKLGWGRSRSDEKSIILKYTDICPDFDWLVIISPGTVNLHPIGPLRVAWNVFHGLPQNTKR